MSKRTTPQSPAPPAVEQTYLFSVARGIDLTPHKIIRIAVSGDIGLNRLETAVIDTPEFQRLRSIRQLGTTHLVYPTALHTRFDHSLGVLAMADSMIRAIRENRRSTESERDIPPEEEQLIRLLALVHDIGHVPFGHTLEDEYRLFERHDRDAERLARLLGPDSRVGGLIHRSLGAELYGRLLALIQASGDKLELLGDDLYIHDLISNTVCADLLDYLRRDSLFCNLTLDLDYRFINFLFLCRHGGARRAVVRLWKEDKPSPRRDVLSELIRLLDNRYLLSERVYYHHAKLTSGAMAAGAVEAALRADELQKEDLYTIGDDVLLDRLARASDPIAASLAGALSERRLHKIAVELPRDALKTDRAESIWREGPARRLVLEQALATEIGAKPGELLLQFPNPMMATKLHETVVYWNGELRALHDCAENEVVQTRLASILESHRGLWAIRVFVTAELRDRASQIEQALLSLLKSD